MLIFFQIASLFLYRKIFLSLNLAEKKNQIKTHTGIVPYSGGVSLFTVVFFYPFFITVSYPLLILIFFSSALSLLFLFDDLKGISPKVRLLIQIFFSFLFILILLNYFSFFINLSSKDIVSVIFAIVFFCIFQATVTNSINLIDGVDGLASGCVFISLISLFLAHLGKPSDIQFILFISISLFIFMFFNFSQKKKIFLGDNGSVPLGFTLFGLVFISYMSKFLIFSSLPWLFGAPLLGLLRIVFIRLFLGRHPFYGDRNHIHYILLDNFLCKYQTVFAIFLVHSLLCAVGLLINFYNVSFFTSALLYSNLTMIYILTTLILFKNKYQS